MSDNENALTSQYKPLSESKLKELFLHNCLEAMIKKSQGLKSDFPERMQTYNQGSPLVFKISEDGIATMTSEAYVYEALDAYMREKKTPFIYKYREIKDSVDKFMATSAARIDEYPHALLFKDDKRIAFHKFSYKIEELASVDAATELIEKKAPIFMEFLTRCSNWPAVTAFIGSLLDPDSDRSQYLWLYGDGENGKSTLVRFLMATLGGTKVCTKVMPPTKDDKFWLADIVTKRLAVIDDCNEYTFVSKSLFKSVTGDKISKVYRKFKAGSDEPINAKFIITSNDKPEVKRTRAEIRRCLYQEIAPLPVGTSVDGSIHLKMVAEAEYIYTACYTHYLESRKIGQYIWQPKEHIEALIDSHEEDMQSFFDKYFVYTGDTKNRVTVNQIRECLKSERMIEKARWFRRFIKAKYGLEAEAKTGWVNGKAARYYQGVQLVGNYTQNVRPNNVRLDDRP